MNSNNCFGHNNCNPIVFTSDCCDNPQTVPITSQQLGQLITLLNSLITAIAAFFADPSDANRLTLLNLFTQLLDLLNSLAPSPEGNYLKQLIQSIITLLQSPNPDLGQLASLLQQFYSALAPFFFSLILDPASLQLLLNLLTQLIGATPGAGATGPTGATGGAGAGSIIPYASGIPAVLVTVLGGLADTGTVLGFGNSFVGVQVGGGSINLSPLITDFAFVAPRAGTITSLAGFFSATAAISLLGNVQIELQLYSAPATSNTFTPVGTPLLLAPALNIINIGTTSTGISAQAIPVAAQDKILLVVSTNTLGLSLASVIAGFVSAGITFE
ncbi:exosporium glycoprotein BclB-related protein [Bacillus cereus]|uniref:exosporium glycoprotein BclB-related protein n=1 Tax=Bacillus cereus TaxID=1396 RepID=UPI000BFC3FF1|nr:exosporium glycoprotein BclB-related protein [Bacillus cereus]PGS60634.1 collagen-like repeat preface domain-containing protein [Bacillus cereus]